MPRFHHFKSVCLGGYVASMVVAATLPRSAAQQPASFTLRAAEASWSSEDPSQPGDVFQSTVISLRRETTESGELVDHVQVPRLDLCRGRRRCGGPQPCHRRIPES